MTRRQAWRKPSVPGSNSSDIPPPGWFQAAWLRTYGPGQSALTIRPCPSLICNGLGTKATPARPGFKAPTPVIPDRLKEAAGKPISLHMDGSA